MKLLINPEQCQIQSIATETPIHEEKLTPHQLRYRFQQNVVWQQENTDEHLLAKQDNTQAAAVLIPLVMGEQGLRVMLTKRTAHLRDHAGQISFPGGRVDAGDDSVEMTALRETQEEVGLAAKHIELLGKLPAYRTITGYSVTPVVALIHPPFELIPEAFEVESIFDVPLSFLMNPQHHQRREYILPNGLGSRLFYAMPYQEHFIWGASAGMIRNLFHFLRA